MGTFVMTNSFNLYAKIIKKYINFLFGNIVSCNLNIGPLYAFQDVSEVMLGIHINLNILLLFLFSCNFVHISHSERNSIKCVLAGF